MTLNGQVCIFLMRAPGLFGAQMYLFFQDAQTLDVRSHTQVLFCLPG